MTASLASTPERMQCMEVWGGNSRVTREFQVPGLDIWVYSQPYDRAELGGDVYFVSSCASGRITRLLLADVSGHGNAVAEAANGLRDLMRQNVNLIDQTRFVREMNRRFASHQKGGGFATALVCTFFSPTRSLQLSNAGHPPPFVYRAQQHNWTSADALTHVEQASGLADTPLGVAQSAEYSRSDTNLQPGDLVLCVSDAFTESCDATGAMLGSEGLLKLLNNLDSTDAAIIIPQLLENLSLAQLNQLERDDSTAILFRANGSNPSLKDNLLAPMRLVRGVREVGR